MREETNNIKVSLREKYRKLRKGVMHRTQIGEKLLNNCRKVLSLHEGARVAGYIPIDGEIDVVPLMEYYLNSCCEVFVPVVVKGSRLLEFHRWKPEDDAQGKRMRDECFPNVFFVPLVAFDKKLNRLGLGGGFYDYTIAYLREKQECRFIGVAYDLQLCKNIPVHDHDQKLDLIVTEQSIYY